MKTEQQKYETKTGKLMWLSVFLVIIGAVIYFMWSTSGAIIALLGLIGLVWCFMRR